MLDFLFEGQAGIFAVPALVGTALFLLRLAMMLVGFDGDHSHGVDAPSDAHHADPGDGFKLLSLQAIAAFSMGFGWGGLASMRGSEHGPAFHLLVAAASGVFACFVLAWSFKQLFRLRASGNISIESAVGVAGDVYIPVPLRGHGLGQVRVVIDGRQRIFNAVSDTGPIQSHEKIRVVAANHDNTLTVVRLPA
jgi:hypothetical protein